MTAHSADQLRPCPLPNETGRRRKVALRTAAIALAGVWLFAATALAQQTRRPVYQPPTGFWLSPNLHRAQLYGPTQPAANWAVAPWGIPEDLPAFGASGVAQNQWARVAWLGGGRYELSQNATERPCVKTFPSGRTSANEFDLLVQPNNANVPHFPQAVAGNHEALGNLSAIDATIDLTVEQADSTDNACDTTNTTFMFAVVLANKTKHQFLYYQLRLANFSKGGRALQSGVATPVWFFTGYNSQSGGNGQWGFGDNITAYGQPWAQVGVQQRYQLDLLPHLRDLIRDGARYGLDQDLGNWQLTGTYHGQNAVGHIRNKALWNNFSLTTSAR